MKELFLWAVNADQQGTPQQVRKVIDGVRKNKIPVVFSESTVSDKPREQVAKETGARYGGVLYVDSLTRCERTGADAICDCWSTTRDDREGFSRRMTAAPLQLEVEQRHRHLSEWPRGAARRRLSSPGRHRSARSSA